jgi:hypothetical protein
MRRRPLLLVLFACCVLVFGAAADSSHKLKTTDAAPKGVSDAITKQLGPTGYQVSGPDGALVTVWFAKGVDVKADFKPNFMVKYPFKEGQLVGALVVPEGVTYTDFRGQEIAPGAYTLRYGQQPMDGNHIGTSETADFLLALPAKEDTKPEPIAMKDTLNEKSADAAGSTHPAIFSLQPNPKPGQAKLTHNEDRDYWILEAEVGAKGEKKVPVQMVVVGQSDV